MIEATETPNLIEQKAAAPCFQVKRLVMPFYLGFAHNYKGETVFFDDLRGFILERYGIDCHVAQKDEGAVLTTRDLRSVNTLAKEVRFSHDFMIGHLADAEGYQIYIRNERKPQSLRLT